ncbi:CheY-P-specific phosphatase CheC [Ornithinibacillus sp. L9]|uniref:CheY-P-specific phosphatase CheC n=1 Tax=Ornithinibacillus caprae TaxID=2678566 RepID=A0A6N8FJR3_9BACI|nr:chemotaxis protein CheC [Ornithinibacillus caprae]MUK89892.1 CheY-P-specific phosphatase CheC [Ornithinibacillus caprae]
MNYNHLSTIQLDALREIGNIGAGNAATSMSKLINEKIDMQVPNVSIIEFDEVMDMIGGAESLVVAILFQIQGEAPGMVYLLFTVDEAESLVKHITSNSKQRLFHEDGTCNDFAISALKETGNILAGSYLSALSDFTNLNMNTSIPHFSVDMAGAILSVGLLEISHATDYAIIIDTKINDANLKNGINGQFLFLPGPESFEKIFRALGINENE